MVSIIVEEEKRVPGHLNPKERDLMKIKTIDTLVLATRILYEENKSLGLLSTTTFIVVSSVDTEVGASSNIIRAL